MVDAKTISDVAKLARVSKTTVSRYLNGKYEYMSNETRERICVVIEKSGYRPSNIARSMKAACSHTIGCVIGNITNPISASIVQGIVKVSAGRDYNVLFANTNDDPLVEREAIDAFLSNRVDGLLVNPSGGNSAYLAQLQENGMPMVMLDRIIEGFADFDCVTTENDRAIRKCVHHLWYQGYRTIGFFHNGFHGIRNRMIRYQSYINIIKERLGDEADRCVYEIDDTNFSNSYSMDNWDLPCTEKAVLRFIQSPDEGPKAILASNSVTAINLLWVLRKLGLDSFPALGFCSYNDWGMAALVKSGITTITQDACAVGERASDLLFGKIAGAEKTAPLIIEIPNQLIVRSSTLLRATHNSVSNVAK